MTRTGWFTNDNENHLFQESVERMESWQRAIADGVITQEELQEHLECTSALLRRLEPQLNDELHALVTEILLEMAVLNAMQSTLLWQEQSSHLFTKLT